MMPTLSAVALAFFAASSAFAAAAPITDPLVLLKEADRREEGGGWTAREAFLKGMLADCGARIKADAKDARAYALRGLVRLKLYDDGPQTRADLDEAIRLDPANALAYSVRCRNKNRTGESATAIEDCEKAVALEPANPLYYEFRSDLRRFKGSWDDAIADLDKAMSLAPPPARLYRERANHKTYQGKLAEAYSDISTASALAPRNAQIHFWRARLAYLQSLPKEALEAFRRSLALNPQQPEIHLRLWLIRTELGEGPEAARALKATLANTKLFWPSDGWLRTIGSFLAGAIDEDALLAEAEIQAARQTKAQNNDFYGKVVRCHAYFYAGAKRQLAGDKAGAVQFYEKSLASGGADYDNFGGLHALLPYQLSRLK